MSDPTPHLQAHNSFVTWRLCKEQTGLLTSYFLILLHQPARRSTAGRCYFNTHKRCTHLSEKQNKYLRISSPKLVSRFCSSVKAGSVMGLEVPFPLWLQSWAFVIPVPSASHICTCPETVSPTERNAVLGAKTTARILQKNRSY